MARKKPKCKWGKLKRPIGKRICKKKPKGKKRKVKRRKSRR